MNDFSKNSQKKKKKKNDMIKYTNIVILIWFNFK